MVTKVYTVHGQVREEEHGGQCSPVQDLQSQGHGQCPAVGLQHQRVGGGQAGVAPGDAGHGVHGGGDIEGLRTLRTFRTLLSASKVSDSPGFVKSRRKRVPDGLVQRRISHFTILEEKISSEVVPKILGGGPWKSESVRRIKRRMGDSMEGPSGIIKRKRK